MKAFVTIGSLADVGLVRDHQEDAYGYKPLAKLTERERAKGQLFVVADGVGGQQAGEVASRLAVETILREFYAARVDAVESLRLALLAANQEICTAAREMGHEKMATTAVCVVIKGQELIVGHVGDSRAYLWHGDRLQRLTVDHSWVTEQIAAGALSSDAALSHPYRNLITRSLGNKSDVVPEIRHLGVLADGDRIMLCTDGLYDGVSEPEMSAVLRERSSRDACQELVRLANEAGGTDNIAVMVLDIQLIQGDDEVPQLGENGVKMAAVDGEVDVLEHVTSLLPNSTAERAGDSAVGIAKTFSVPLRPSESALIEAADRTLPQPSGTHLFHELECEIPWGLLPGMRESYEICKQIALPDGRNINCELRVPSASSAHSSGSSLQIAVSDGFDHLVIGLLPRGFAGQVNRGLTGQVSEVLVDDDTSLSPLTLGSALVSIDIIRVRYRTEGARQFRGLTVRFQIQVPISANMPDIIHTH